jgi:hypothetical protein
VKILVRLVLLTGAAAAISMMLREPLARRVAVHLAAPVTRLAEAARVTTKPSSMVPMLPPAQPPMLPIVPSASPHVPIVPVPLHKKVSAKPASSVTVLTRKQIEDAIATRVDGAKALLVRDPAGHPIGLRLSHVGKLAPFGVHEGDILVSANGFPLRTPDEAMAALGKLQDARHVVVAFRRGDATFAIPVDLVD